MNRAVPHSLSLSAGKEGNVAVSTPAVKEPRRPDNLAQRA